MGRNLGSAFRQELANLDKDPDTYKTAMSNLRTIVKDLDSKVIHAFLTQVSETKEIGSDSGGGYTVSLFEDLARAHGVKISPHVETIMLVIVRTLSSCGGSLSVQQACSKAVAAIARYGIDPATAEDKKRNVIHSLCKPLSDSLIDSHHQQHLALGSALCLKSLVDCDSWRYASNEMVNSVCQSLAVALEATSSEAESHLALVIALAKRNAFIVEAYARLLVKSGLRILELGVVEGDAQKRVLAVQMLNFLMKYLNPKSISSEVELVLQEMEKHMEDEVYFVRMAVHDTLGTAERLIREADSSVKSTTPSLRSRNRSYVNDQEDDYNQETGSRNQIQFSGDEDDNMESVCFHQRNRSSEFNESVCSRTNRPRSSRRNRRKRQSERSRHGFTQDSFTVLLENREQLRQYSESSSSSSPIHERSGTTTPTEDICEKLKIDLESEAKVKREEIVTESTRRDRSKKSVLRWGLSFFSVVLAGLASFMWVHLQDDVMMPHLVPT
ncbi:ARM repeat superfamily protein [Raphanus sativus]|uniref:Protein SINE2-like n=1 Tax=Raphanus sativus TaxID=3726 RepID=A0A9W3C072_RAPSA|nr:protein SINE2-like [Raphanus sativus]KAJ4886218.1 ARM repeat superfamily protein [Raphanus sativus]